MISSPATDPPPPCAEPFRWHRAASAQAFDHFGDPNHRSQRQYAEAESIPRSTLGYWLRRKVPADLDSERVAFLRGPAGEAFLRELVLAAFLVFHQQGSCGLRLLGRFLELAHLAPFVATSYGALHSLATRLQDDLGAFTDEERPRLAAQMTPRTITLTADENFHSPPPCLVAIEPVSNFLVVESYRERRDGDTWTAAIREGLRDLPVTVVLLNSDLAKGLLRCARHGLSVLHSPDLFHGQRDLLRPLLVPLQRPIQQAEKELAKARQHSDSLDGAVSPEELGQMPLEEIEQLVEAIQREEAAAQRLQQVQEHKEQVVQEVRGVGDDYHPFDRETGRPVTAEQVSARLVHHIQRLAQVAEQAGLGERAQETLTKARSWLGTLVAVVAWFWSLARQRVEKLELSEEQERVVYECLLPGYYWAAAARRARKGGERKRLEELAQRLQQEAWAAEGALATLWAEERKAVERVVRECAGLLSRSSSCVEGRNGRLALHHHGQGRLSESKLKALTTVHNYVVRRADGTTAAERFFGVKPRDVFAWLLERMPDLPRPAAKRPKKPSLGLPKAG